MGSSGPPLQVEGDNGTLFSFSTEGGRSPPSPRGETNFSTCDVVRSEIDTPRMEGGLVIKPVLFDFKVSFARSCMILC